MNAISRRQFLQLTAATTSSIILPKTGLASTEPGLQLTATQGVVSLRKGHQMQVWGFNKSIPGPEIRVRRGDTVRVRLTNQLVQPTSVHWHGIRIRNDMDGVPNLTQSAVDPNEYFDYEFVVPDAGTFWYHSHKASPEQVGRGLYGLLVVEETEPYPVDREIPLVVDDWLLGEDGQIQSTFGAMHDIAHAGRMGNWITVNGRIGPEIHVEQGERLRFRVVNTANSRVMMLDFDPHEPYVIAIDGQPIRPTLLDKSRLMVAPGQRFDLVMDMTADPGTRTPFTFIHRNGVVEIANIVYGNTPGKTPTDKVPAALESNLSERTIDISGASRHAVLLEGGAMGGMRKAVYQDRELSIQELVNVGKLWSINGVAGMSDKPLFSVKQGQTVLLDLMNDNRWPHAMHLHGHHFRVLEINGETQAETPWRDTIMMDGGERSKIAFVADNPGKWLLHCHMLEHQMGGMVSWIEVA